MFRPVRRKTGPQTGTASADTRGAIAQLGERYNGIVEVVGSIPSGSTNSPIPASETRVLQNGVQDTAWAIARNVPAHLSMQDAHFCDRRCLMHVNSSWP